uniref:RAD9, HUS1, RAD1-interacting nuclear orphan protein 1 n=1 Tax=Jaculus jaculus TaxID=51337 RepID=A0A8C5NX97_JACJA
VLPQFDVTESRFPAHRKRHDRNQARHSSRKSSCKFPCLSFASPQSSSTQTVGLPSNRDCSSPSEKDASRRPLVPMLSPQSCGERSTHTLQSLPHVFVLPDIQTPKSSPGKEDPVPSDQRENALAAGPLLSGAPDSPEPGPVLVKDTPEDKYGIKVTWRRRQHLFAYLRATGKLSRSQFLVKS